MIQAGHPLLKNFTVFYSFFNVLFNLFKRRMQMTNFKKPTDYPRFVAAMVALWFVPGILSEILAGRGPDDDEPWDEYLTRTAWAWAGYPLQSIALVREIVNGMGPYGYDGPPVVEALAKTGETLTIPPVGGAAAGAVVGAALTRSPYGAAAGSVIGGVIGTAAMDEELSRADVRTALLAAGYWGHLPSRQAWITGSYIYDWATGEENPENAPEAAAGLAFARKP